MKHAWSLLLVNFLSLHIYGQNRYDVVINELMADPSPSVGLPNNEWIELKNTSPLPVNLLNWRIGDLSGQSGPLPNFILQPDSLVIICASSAVQFMGSFGNTIPVANFPSLDNDADQLFLKSAGGQIIHAVSYNIDWYHNELKKEGGWSLEMIDPMNPCTGSANWKASNSVTGGTPGKKNTVDAINKDDKAPKLKRAYTAGPNTIVLLFDEPLDSLSGTILTNYTVDGGLSFISAITIAPLFNEVELKTSISMLPNTIYSITANLVKDCKGNAISGANTVKTGLPADPVQGEWIINEILFNPRPSAFDYIELYNNSNKIMDASKLYLANRNTTGVISSVKILSTVPFYIFPGDHIVITEDASNLAINYLVKNPENVLVIPPLPSYSDDEGNVIALNFQGNIVDEVHYKKDWHFKLISNDEGVALEKIEPGLFSQDKINWHSAASTAGYGTPTYKNSQYKQLIPGQTSVTDISIFINPRAFSPDNDGRDDIATIQYNAASPGYAANITIFDAAGRPVRQLVRNAILGLNGYWNWDGTGDNGRRLNIGSYIIFTSIFDLQGKKAIFKNNIVLARKF